jgi:hypothetical protein
MRIFSLIMSIGILSLLLAGCAADGGMRNPFSSSSEPEESASTHYFSEFSDIPIPKEMKESRGDTFIIFAPSGVKTGVQRFSGKVELVSLMNVMRRNMAANGWTMRSLLRAKESVLVFDKPDRLAAFQISDGLFTTSMSIFVTSRLEGDSPSSDITYYTPDTPGEGAGGSRPLSQ